jgi:hypothetical protein
MAITTSGLYVLPLRDALDTTQYTIDYLVATHKICLVSDTHTPNFDTHVSYSDITNEVSGGSWSSGGVLLSAAAAGSTSVTPTWGLGNAGQLKYDHTNDVSVATTTLASAMAAVIYADAQTPKHLLCLVDFVTAATTSNGTFGITWDALGIFTIDLVPA